MRRIIYDGDSFYELDEDCLRQKEEIKRRKEMEWQKNNAQAESVRRSAKQKRKADRK
ncbi:MAG: hypothetical protein LUG54_06655 [Clostridiales bacterium]|nr:hypothetical protein [Clostridiales bacterium]